MKLLIMRPSPASSPFLPHRTKYWPQHPVLKDASQQEPTDNGDATKIRVKYRSGELQAVCYIRYCNFPYAMNTDVCRTKPMAASACAIVRIYMYSSINHDPQRMFCVFKKCTCLE